MYELACIISNFTFFVYLLLLLHAELVLMYFLDCVGTEVYGAVPAVFRVFRHSSAVFRRSCTARKKQVEFPPGKDSHPLSV